MQSFEAPVNEFIKTQKGIRKRVLINNQRNILQMLQESVTLAGVITSRMQLVQSLDFISLYDEFPSTELVAWTQWNVLYKEIHELSTEILLFVFDKLKYKDSLHIKELLSVEIKVTSFFLCFTERPEMKSTERCALKGHNAGKRWTVAAQPLVVHEAQLMSTRKKLVELTSTYACDNESCTSPITVVEFHDRSFITEAYKYQVIKRTSSKQQCNTCRSALQKKSTGVCTEHVFWMNIISGNGELVNCAFQGIYQESRECEREQFNRFKPAVVVGHYERNERGNWKFHALLILEKEKVMQRIQSKNSNYLIRKENSNYLIRKENSNYLIRKEDSNYLIKSNNSFTIKTKQTTHKLISTVERLLWFKKTVTETDIQIAVIVSILGSFSRTEQATGFFLLSSPPSNTTEQHITNSAVLIHTNDVNYVMYIAKALTDAPVLYSAKEFERTAELYDRCICVVDQCIKKKQTHNLEFSVLVTSSDYHDYSYTKKQSLKSVLLLVPLTAGEVLLVNEIFTRQRKQLKGLIEPVKLLNRIEHLAVALKMLTGESEALYLIETRFISNLIC